MRSALSTMLVVLLAGAPAAVAAGATKAWPVAAFDAVEVGGAWTVDLKAGKPRAVSIRATDARDHGRIEVRVSGGELRLALKPGLRPYGDLFATIAAPKVRKLALAGTCHATGAGFAGGKLELELAGMSKARLAGRVDALEAELAGACGLDAEKLVTKAVELDARGTSNAVVHATTTLDVKAAGMCRVEYLGAPKVTTEGTWTSSVRKRK